MRRTTSTYVAVVDDDESVCRSFGRLLRAAGIRPITYPSGEAFFADTQHPRFDCLVLDIQLGGMSGIEIAQQLADVADRTPIIFITAHDDGEVREQAQAVGCVAYFRKTDSGADVLEAISVATAHADGTIDSELSNPRASLPSSPAASARSKPAPKRPRRIKPPSSPRSL